MIRNKKKLIFGITACVLLGVMAYLAAYMLGLISSVNYPDPQDPKNAHFVSKFKMFSEEDQARLTLKRIDLDNWVFVAQCTKEVYERALVKLPEHPVFDVADESEFKSCYPEQEGSICVGQCGDVYLVGVTTQLSGEVWVQKEVAKLMEECRQSKN